MLTYQSDLGLSARYPHSTNSRMNQRAQGVTLSSLLCVLDGSLGPAFLVDTQGNVLHINRTAQGFLGVADASAPRNVSSFLSFPVVDKCDASSWEDVTEGFAPGCVQQYEGAHLKTGDGMACPVKLDLVKLESLPNSSVAGAQPNENDTDCAYICVYIRAHDVLEPGRSFPLSTQMEERDDGSDRMVLSSKNNGSDFPTRPNETHELKEHDDDSCFIEREDIKHMKDELALSTSVLNASFDPVFCINEYGTIQQVNEAAVKRFGWSHEEFSGENISIICGGVHSKNHDMYMQNYLKTGVTRVMGKKRELIAKRKDNTEFPIELGLVEMDSIVGKERVFCGFIRDLTDQKAHEAEMKQKTSLTEGILDASFDSMFAIDEHGKILMVNKSSTKCFGWLKKEFLGQNISMIVGAEHANKHDGYIKTYLKTGVKKMMGKQRILEARRKDGSVFPVWLGLTEVSTDGDAGNRRFVAFVRDLTDQKKLFEMQIKYAKATGLLRDFLPEEYYQHFQRMNSI